MNDVIANVLNVALIVNDVIDIRVLNGIVTGIVIVLNGIVNDLCD